MDREVVAVDAMADNLAYITRSLELANKTDKVVLIHNSIRFPCNFKVFNSNVAFLATIVRLFILFLTALQKTLKTIREGTNLSMKKNYKTHIWRFDSFYHWYNLKLQNSSLISSNSAFLLIINYHQSTLIMSHKYNSRYFGCNWLGNLIILGHKYLISYSFQAVGPAVFSVTLPDIFSSISSETFILKMDIQGYECKVAEQTFLIISWHLFLFVGPACSRCVWLWSLHSIHIHGVEWDSWFSTLFSLPRFWPADRLAQGDWLLRQGCRLSRHIARQLLAEGRVRCSLGPQASTANLGRRHACWL